MSNTGVDSSVHEQARKKELYMKLASPPLKSLKSQVQTSHLHRFPPLACNWLWEEPVSRAVARAVAILLKRRLNYLSYCLLSIVLAVLLLR